MSVNVSECQYKSMILLIYRNRAKAAPPVSTSLLHCFIP
nr:MAG TPA: hypothetical protein [Caudoviricetes sp.]